MSTFPPSPKLIKGALVEFSKRFISVAPNVIIFQYNPEKMTRKLEAWYAAEGNSKSGATEAATAQPVDPDESFELKLELDATDALEKPESHPVGFLVGVADRIAALEMLLYPEDEATGGGLLGSVTSTLSSAATVIGGANKKTDSSLSVPRGTVPTVLFVWGPGRIVPVRLTSFSVEEQAYSPTLYPIRASVSVGLKIMAPKNFPCSKKEADNIAVTAYNIYRRQKQGLAAANIVNNAESIIGMLPL